MHERKQSLKLEYILYNMKSSSNANRLQTVYKSKHKVLTLANAICVLVMSIK